jgi:hypothetical protein
MMGDQIKFIRDSVNGTISSVVGDQIRFIRGFKCDASSSALGVGKSNLFVNRSTVTFQDPWATKSNLFNLTQFKFGITNKFELVV